MKKRIPALLIFLTFSFFLIAKNNNHILISFPGTMDLTAVEVCEGETVIPAHNNDEVLDPGDVLAFVIHDESGPFLGNVLALEFGANPEFSMNTLMNFGTTYYLSAIAGNDAGGGVIDLQDPDLAVAEGTPITFVEVPPSFLEEFICEGDSILVEGQYFDATGIYNVPLLNPTGCLTEIELDLTVLNPIVTGNPVHIIDCNNWSVFLEPFVSNTTGQLTYSWPELGIFNSPNISSMIVNNPGNFTVVVTETIGNVSCTTSFQFLVIEDWFPPNVSAGPNQELDCLTGEAVLDGSGSSVGPNFIYSWTGPPNNTHISSNLITTVTLPGTYILTVLNAANGCLSQAEVEVTNGQSLEVEIGGPLFLDCANNPITIQPTTVPTGAGITYQWTTTNGNILSGANTSTPVVDAAGIYLLEVENGLCMEADEVEVSSFATSANAGQNMTLTCNQTSATIGDNNTITGTNITYQWTDFSGVVISTDPMTQVNEAGIYTLVISDIVNGCSSSDEVEVFEDYNVPVVVVSSSIPALDCNNQIVTLDGTGSSTGPDIIYEWLDATGWVISTSLNVNVFTAGGYTLRVTNTSNGCTSEGFILVNNVSANIDIQIPSTFNLNCNNNFSADLNPIVTGGTVLEYFWSGPNGFTSTDMNITVAGQNNSGVYVLTVVDAISGCSQTVDIIVNYEGLFFLVDVVNADCDMSNGSATLIHNATNISFQWSTGETTPTINNLAQGWYSVTVTDPTLNCSQHENFYVDEDLSCKVVIGGEIVKDPNMDCVYDPSMDGIEAVMVKLEPLGIFTFSDADGNYEFVVDDGSYTVEFIGSSFVDLLCPTPGTYDVTLNTNGTTSLDNHFFVDRNDYDLCLTKFTGNARPGFKQFNCVQACNYSAGFQSAVVTFTHDPIFGNVASLPNIFPINSVAYNYTYDPATYTFTWMLDDMEPGECIKIMFRMLVPGSSMIGDQITGSAKVSPIAGDVNPENNCLDWTQILTASYDPNDKRNMIGETQWGGAIEMDDETMEYAIRFQNVGTDTAFTVVIRDTIDTDHLDVTTIRGVTASHDYQIEFEDHNVLIFRFENIMLVDSFTNEPGSNGWVSYNIDRYPGLPFGTEITNQAAIYFDFNDPVITNEVVNIIENHFYNVQGIILDEDNDEVEQVNVSVTGDAIFNSATGANGSFLFENIQIGSQLEIDFEKNINPLNGVTTFDLVLIQKHILGVELLDSPYKIIAADINHSEDITTFDLIGIKSLLLQMSSQFPNNESWRFVDSEFTFTDPANPFLDDFPESISILNLDNDRQIEMVGIKIGDVNGSASPNLFTQAHERDFNEKFSLKIDNQSVRVGEEVLIPFVAEDFTSVQAMQFTLEFEKDKMSFVGFEKALLENMSLDDFGFSFLEKGKINLAYATPELQKFNKGDVLFYLKFKSLKSTELKEVFRITDLPTASMVYDEVGNAYGLDLKFENQTSIATLDISPNPTNEKLFLNIYLEKENNITIEIYNSFGQLEKTIFKIENSQRGISQKNINVSELSSGTYFIHLKTNDQSIIQRFVKL